MNKLAIFLLTTLSIFVGLVGFILVSGWLITYGFPFVLSMLGLSVEIQGAWSFVLYILLLFSILMGLPIS